MTGDELGKSVEKAFEAPAKALEGSIRLAKRGEEAFVNNAPVRKAGEYWKTLGPGFITGAADDDPSGIATYSQAGAKYGFQLIWTALFTYPFMAAVQEMCARIGIVSGQGLAANIRTHFPAGALYTVTILLFAANSFNIAANLGAMAAAAELVMPGTSVKLLVVLFALLSLVLQVFTTYDRYAAYLKYLTLALLSYVFVAFSVGLDWQAVFRSTFMPSFDFTRDQFFLLAAIFGTTISPYLFFWQTSQEVEEGVRRGERTVAARRHEVNDRSIRRMRTDVWSGMFFSNLITFFIFAATAGTLYANGITDVATAADAAAALKPFGSAAFFLFALGIIGTGMLSVPILAGSAAYAIAESFGWKSGLYRRLRQAYSFYGVIIVAMGIGIAANFMHLDPIKGLIYAAVANAVIAPIILFFIVRLAGDKRLMGGYANGRFSGFMGWTAIAIMGSVALAAIGTLF